METKKRKASSQHERTYRKWRRASGSHAVEVAHRFRDDNHYKSMTATMENNLRKGQWATLDEVKQLIEDSGIS